MDGGLEAKINEGGTYQTFSFAILLEVLADASFKDSTTDYILLAMRAHHRGVENEFNESCTNSWTHCRLESLSRPETISVSCPGNAHTIKYLGFG